MIQITDKSQCCGCTACASICAHDAITMQPDALGFLYPVVDKDKCVDCGLLSALLHEILLQEVLSLLYPYPWS